MNKIKIDNWKSFYISEIFYTEKNGKNIQVPTGAMISKKLLEDGTTPRVTVSNFNNGIIGYYSDLSDKNYRVYKNFISVSFLGTVFYHPNKASLDMKVHCLKPIKHNLNLYTATFLVNIIKKAISNFAYQDQLSSTVLPNLIIKLPIKNKEPDWEYMESYMKHIMQESAHNIGNLQNINNCKKKINLNNWRSFKIGALFEPLKTGFIGSGKKIGSATKKPDKEHTIPLTCAKYGDNGIMYWGRKGDFITHSNILAVIRDGAVATGMVYAENDETGVYSHSYFIKLKNYDVSFEVNLYLSCILTKTIYPKYTRNDTCVWERIREDEILLPVISTKNEPDWEYMGNYMKEIFEKAKHNLSLLGMN